MTPKTFKRDQPSDLQPLEIEQLARIWYSLPEDARPRFLISLDEQLGNRLFEATMPRVLDQAPDPWRSDSADVSAWLAAQQAKIVTRHTPKRQPRLDSLSSDQLRQIGAATSQEQVDRLLDRFTKESTQ